MELGKRPISRIDNVHTMYILHSMNTLNIRIDKKIKKQASETLAAMGLDMSSAIKLFLNQVIIEQGLPFRPKRTPKEIRAEWDRDMKEARENGKIYKTAAAAMKEILK